MANNLLILGAGQYGKVVQAVAKDIGGYDRIEFLDDVSDEAIGKWSQYEEFRKDFDCAFVGVGDNKLRLEWFRKLVEAGYTIPTLIHPRAYVFDTAEVGIGTIIEPMAVIHSNVSIGKGCIIAAGSVICHGAVLENGVNCFSGCVVEESAVLKNAVTTEVNSVVHARSILSSPYDYNFDAGV